MADAKTERSRAIAIDLNDVRKRWFDEGFKAGAEAERARMGVSSRSYSSFQQTERELTMTNEVLLKTEHQNLLGSLLISAQRSLINPASDSFTIPLGNLCNTCGAKREDLLRLFSAENPVTVGDFVLCYERERDRIHFDKTKPFGAGPVTSFAPPASPAAAPAATLGASQKVASMSPAQVEAVAKANWLQDPKLSNEFTSEAAYIAFCKMEAQGRIRILGRTRVQ
jgi:hypothetical protein